MSTSTAAPVRKTKRDWGSLFSTVGIEGGVAGPPTVLEDLLVVAQRGDQHPVEGRQAVDDDEDDTDGGEDLSPVPLGLVERCSQTATERNQQA